MSSHIEVTGQGHFRRIRGQNNNRKQWYELCMIMPNGTDNIKHDVIATINVTSWVTHYHTISMDTKAI